MRLNFKKYSILGLAVLMVFLFAYLFVFRKNVINVGSSEKNGSIINIFNRDKDESKTTGSITGQECSNASQRPYAVMLAGDIETRPLSGIGEADLVVEMPVAPNGITRFMALYQCGMPKEIGSIRSSRADFIPLAGGFNAIYAHWGGEHDALAALNSGVLNNIDGLKYDGTTYYRKSGIPRPHNGFTTLANLQGAAKSLGYKLDNTFVAYPHLKGKEAVARNIASLADTVSVPYPAPFGVTWKYDSAKNFYLRSRGDKSEIDRNTNQQVSAKVVVVMHTESSFIRDQYIHVRTTGEGRASIYQNGSLIEGTWKKDPKERTSKLMFLDAKGDEIKFVPGNIWVEVVPE